MDNRVRTRGAVAPVLITESSKQTLCTDPNWTTVSSGQGYEGTLEWMQDAVVPKFARRRAAGEIIFNNMSLWRREYHCFGSGYAVQSTNVSCGTTGWKAQYKSDGPWIAKCVPTENVLGQSGLPNMVWNFTNRDIDLLAYEVSTDLLSRRGRGDSNIYEDLAEFEKTLDMFRNPILKLSKWITTISRAARAGNASRKQFETATGLYLAYRYGLKPVVQDFQNVIKALQKTQFRTRQTTRSSKTLVMESNSLSTTRIGVLDHTVNRYVKDTLRVRGMSLDEINNSLVDDLGISPKSLVTLPWELTSYSFVLDWFLNVGDYINALTPAFGWNQLGSCLVVEHDTMNIHSMVDTVSNSTAYQVLTKPQGYISVNEHAKRRGPLYSPKVVLKSDFRFDKATRVADAISLLAQRGRKTFASIGR